MFTGDKGGIAARWQPADHVQGAVLADRTVSPYGLSAKSCYQLRDSVLSCRHQRAAVRERSLTVGVSEPATNRRMNLADSRFMIFWVLRLVESRQRKVTWPFSAAMSRS